MSSAVVVERDERPGEAHVDQVRRDQQHRCSLRTSQSDVLRHHLTEQDMQRHHDRQRQGVQQRRRYTAQPERQL